MEIGRERVDAAFHHIEVGRGGKEKEHRVKPGLCNLPPAETFRTDPRAAGNFERGNVSVLRLSNPGRRDVQVYGEMEFKKKAAKAKFGGVKN